MMFKLLSLKKLKIDLYVVQSYVFYPNMKDLFGLLQLLLKFIYSSALISNLCYKY